MDKKIYTLQNNRNVQIGNICVQFSLIEYLLAKAIWSLLGLDDDAGLAITGTLAVEARVNMAVALATKLGQTKETVDALKYVQKALQSEKIIERRNQAVHGHRTANPNDLHSEMITMHRGKNAGKGVIRTDTELAQIGKDIAELHKPLLQALAKADLLA